MPKNIQLDSPKYRPDIDSLRSIAILAVVGFHAFPKSFPSGFIGVDIFFVISGYLISSIVFSNLEDGHFSFVEFYSRRIKRIFPALILVLTAVLALGTFVLFSGLLQLRRRHEVCQSPSQGRLLRLSRGARRG